MPQESRKRRDQKKGTSARASNGNRSGRRDLTTKIENLGGFERDDILKRVGKANPFVWFGKIVSGKKKPKPLKKPRPFAQRQA